MVSLHNRLGFDKLLVYQLSHFSIPGFFTAVHAGQCPHQFGVAMAQFQYDVFEIIQVDVSQCGGGGGGGGGGCGGSGGGGRGAGGIQRHTETVPYSFTVGRNRRCFKRSTREVVLGNGGPLGGSHDKSPEEQPVSVLLSSLSRLDTTRDPQ